MKEKTKKKLIIGGSIILTTGLGILTAVCLKQKNKIKTLEVENSMRCRIIKKLGKDNENITYQLGKAKAVLPKTTY